MAYLCWTIAGQPQASLWLAQDIFYDGALLMGALACFLRGLKIRENSTPWFLFAAGLVAWTLGDAYYYAALNGLSEIPYPSLADVGYLSAIPCFFVAIVLLARQRISSPSRTMGFDGAMTAAAAASAAVALLGPAFAGLTNGRASVVLTNLAYPVWDILLVAFLAAVLSVSGIRGAKSLFFIGAGLLAWTAADGIYLWVTSSGHLTSGYTDLLWPVGAIAIGSSAVASVHSPIIRIPAYRPGYGVPFVATLIAAGVMVWDHFSPTEETSVWMAAATLLLVAARLGVSFRENESLVSTLHNETVTDHLTGLRNRRALIGDLGHMFERSDLRRDPHVFVLFDLDGFKAYNDSFGHPAGDVLLRRLAERLRSSVEPFATSYRLGGDEFCVLASLGERRAEGIVEMARSALIERGEGFAIGASCGSVIVPAEAASDTEVLHLADKRLYAEKARRDTRTGDQTRNLLLGIVRERDPILSHHANGVARLAVALGRRVELDAEDIDVLTRAAELHDIGKIAVPEDMLDKVGPLSDDEWQLMHRHTVIGERLLSATPALTPVARIVRSSHERWDGRGYPDGLAGQEIPLLSRIVFVCDAYEAMREKRPYTPSMSVDEAIAELRRNAGTQFDPGLVEVFCRDVVPAAEASLAAARGEIPLTAD